MVYITRLQKLSSWINLNRKKSILLGLVLVYMLQSFFPTGYGYVYHSGNNKPVKDAWVIIKYVGNDYYYYLGHGRSDACIDVFLVKTNNKGGYLIPGLPFYHSLRYANESVKVYGYKRGLLENGPYSPNKLEKNKGYIFMAKYSEDDDIADNMDALYDIVENELCSKPFWSQTSKNFYRDIYRESKKLEKISNGPNRFNITRSICNLAIGDPHNEPRADECPWLED